MLIIDSHLDLAWNALQWNRNLLKPVETIRQVEAEVKGPGRGQGTVALPQLREGRVAICFATLLARCTGTPVAHIDYDSAEQAYGVAQGQLAFYKALEAQGHLRILTQPKAVQDHMKEWTAWEQTTGMETPLVGVVISMESADPILAPAQLGQWQAAGVRLIGPAHYGPGRYAGGTGSTVGLTELGKALVREMATLGILLDMTHLSDEAFWEALELYPGRVVASHNNCRTLVPHQRQFDDQQLRAIIARDGVIGAALDNWMIRPGWKRGATDNAPVRLADVVAHIDHVCQVAGNSRHAALGSDLDGGFGREQSPEDLESIADLQKFQGLLEDRGYAESDVAAILHGNWLRVLSQLPNG